LYLIRTGELVTCKHNLNIKLKRAQSEVSTQNYDQKTRRDLAFNGARYTATYRDETLFLVTHLASFAVWLISKIAELKQWHRHSGIQYRPGEDAQPAPWRRQATWGVRKIMDEMKLAY
jgi:hypothetical protein